MIHIKPCDSSQCKFIYMSSKTSYYTKEGLEKLKNELSYLKTKGRADIARLLSVSERTLQRQLQREGATFQQLLDITRQELAESYLRQPDVSLAEASYMLGFAEQSNFTRASKRWFNLSPGQYRAKLAIEALVDGGELG